MATDQDYCADCGHNHTGPCADDATSGPASGAALGAYLAVAWPAGDLDDAPHGDAYGCDDPECTICDGTEQAWS